MLALEQESPDCLILDVSLEGLDGPGLQSILIASGRLIPTIFITANATEAIRRRVMNDGAVDLLMKPFGEVELLEAIHKALPGALL